MNFDFSPKNIPLGDEKTYFEMMIHAIEKFGRNISWRAFFKLNPHLVSQGKETFGFRSIKAHPRPKQLKDFEKDLAKLMQNIRFRNRGNKFLANLKQEIRRISQQKNKLKTGTIFTLPTQKI